MRKLLLSLATLFVATTAAFAQVSVSKAGGFSLDKSAKVMKAPAKAAPLKADLASNQRLLGYYTSDAVADYGLGLASYGAYAGCRAAIDLPTELLERYDGMKVVAIRFAVCAALDSTSVFIAPIANGAVGADVVSVHTDNVVTGWNTITLPTPYTIDKNQEFFAGFNFNQKATKSGSYYTDDCYPISAVEEGRTDMPLLMYCNIPASYSGSGPAWYNFGTDYGNLSVQLVVEGDFNDYDVTPSDFKNVTAGLNTEKAATISFSNFSKEAVNSLDYIVSVDGVAGTEQHTDLASAVAMCNDGTFDITIPAQTTTGTKTVSVEVTKVNGNANQATTKTASGTLVVVDKVFDRNCLVEEFTTEKCPNCPSGAKILKNALAKVDETRVFTACHHSGYYTDWLTKTWDNDITSLMFGGTGSTFAPGIMFNRTSDILPSGSYGNVMSLNSYNATVIAAYMNNQLKETSNAALQISATPNEDGTVLNVTVKGECNDGLDKENTFLTFYLTQDSVKANSQSGASGKYYHMHVIRYANSSWGESVTWNDDNTFEKNFSVELTATWTKSNLKLIAFLNGHNASDYSDNKVVNSIGCDYPLDADGISGVVSDGQNVEVARYTIDGQLLSAPQKGLNIVKMSDGTTMKVMVK